MRLRTKLSLAFALLAVLPLLVVVPWAIRQLRHSLSQELDARLEAAASVSAAIVEGLHLNAKHAVNELAASTEVEELARSLHEGVPPVQLKSRALELMGSRRLTVLSLLDAKGRTLASGHLPARVGDVDDALFALTRGNVGGQAVTVEVRGDEGATRAPALLAAASPSYAYGDLRLWVVGGVLLDATLCERLAQMTGAQVELWFEGRAVGSSGNADRPRVRVLALGPGTELKLAFGTQAMRDAEAAVVAAFLSAALVALMAALLLGYVISRRTTRPVEALTRATRAVAAGDLRGQVQERATGELGELVTAFNRMTHELHTTTGKLVAAERIAAWQEVARRLAHELKNPLTPIQMSLETMVAAQRENHPSFPTLFTQSAGALLEEVERLRRIVDEFSRFARLPRPQRSDLDIGELVQQVVSLYPPDQKVRILPSIDAGVRASADRDQLTQVLLNLLQNAHDAMPDGGAIRVRVARRSGHAVVEVEDAGPGVPAELKSRIFEPYFTSKGTGTGLGLAIAARICQEHGGSLTVTDATPQGAVFTLTL